MVHNELQKEERFPKEMSTKKSMAKHSSRQELAIHETELDKEDIAK
jgi:hypothetical protein